MFIWNLQGRNIVIRHILTISKWVILSSLRSGIGLFFDIVFPVLWLLFACYVFAKGIKVALLYTIIQTLVLSTMVSSIFGLGILFVDLRKSGVLRHLYTTTVSKHSIIIGTIVGRLLINLAQIILVLIVSEYFYKVALGTMWLVLAVFTIICSVGYAGITLLLSHIAKTSENYHAIANVVYFPFIFLTGVTIPYNILPPFLQKIGKLLPPYHMLELGQNLIYHTATFGNSLFNLLVIFFVGFIGYLKVSIDYRWDPNHKPKYPLYYDAIIMLLVLLIPFVGLALPQIIKRYISF